MHAFRMGMGMTDFRRALPAIALFVMAPLIAEFVPGNMSISMLGTLAVLAPLYGGGALLIREMVRRSQRGWISIVVLALAYGVLEEGIVMQSLFNLNFLGLNQHLLAPAHLSSLGMGGWWTVYVLTLHTVWSITVPIALTEALAPKRSREPWLNGVGLLVVILSFLADCVLITISTVQRDPVHFVASGRQIGAAILAMAIIVVIAFRMPALKGTGEGRAAPTPMTAGAAAFVAGSLSLLIPPRWGWVAVCLYFALDSVVIAIILTWSTVRDWGIGHRLGLSAGAAAAYAAHAFMAVPVAGNPSRVGNVVFALGLLVVVVVAAVRTRRAEGVSCIQEEVI
jgi:hypothetical protein